MSEEPDEIEDNSLLDRLGNILEKAATSPAGIGLLAVLIGGLLKSTHRPAYRIIDKPDPVTGQWHGTGGMLVPESPGLDVILVKTKTITGSITKDIEVGLGLLGLDAWNWILGAFGAKPVPEPNIELKEGATIYLSDMLIAAGLVAIGGSGISGFLKK